MSHISQLKTTFRDQECLLKALTDQGFLPEEIEIHTEAVVMEGDIGNKANIIIRRAAIRRLIGSHAYTDMGFEKLPDGTYRTLIDEWHFKEPWVNTLTQRYNRALSLKKAKTMGYVVNEQKLDTGAIRLTLRR